MSNILVWSDLHGYSFRYGATMNANGISNRLQDSFDVVDQILYLAIEHKVDLVLFAGDLFHQRKHIETAAFNGIYERIAKFAMHKIPLVMIPGNHDQATLDGKEHSIYSFQSLCTVLADIGWYSVKGKSGKYYSIFAVPYRESLYGFEAYKVPNTSARIFLGHFGVNGAKVGADYVYADANDPKILDLSPELFDVGFLGHFHMHQSLGHNFWYVGAPLQHNWGDKGQDRGCVLYNTENKIVTHIDLSYPEFLEIDEDKEDITDASLAYEPYVRIISNRQWSEDEVEATRLSLEARVLEIIPTPIKDIEELIPRLEVNPTMPIDQMLEKYIDSPSISLDGLDKDYLKELGRKIISRVNL